MIFDDCLEDKQEAYACHCGGTITKDAYGRWVCDDCDFSAQDEDGDEV